jgi:hypothetical protein
MPSLRIVLASFPLLVTACGGTVGSELLLPPTSDAASPATPPRADDSGVAPIGSACTGSGDCPSGEVCAWSPGEDVCNAFNPAGVCVKLIVEGCQVAYTIEGCGCDGQTVTWAGGCTSYPDGYGPYPLAHAGACVGVTPVPIEVDAGEPDADDPVPVDLDASLPSTIDADGPLPPEPSGCATAQDCPEGEQCGFFFGDCGGESRCLPAQDFGLCDSVMAACTCTGETTYVPACAEAASQPIAHIGSCDADGGF